MGTPIQNPLTSARFVNMCVANGFLHIYIYAMLPLLSVRMTALGASPTMLGWAVLAFAFGMILPGPFGAYLMERRSRKEVFLKAMLAIGFLATLAYLSFPIAWVCVAVHGIQGMAFGVAQTALGTTLVNDVLLSKHRSQGDLVYAWAGRLGIPLGLLYGFVLSKYTDFPNDWWLALVPCALSFLIVAQTPVPLKAPVKVSLVTCDRFFLPQSAPLIFTLFVSPWMMGRMVGIMRGEAECCALAVGIVAVFVFQILVCKSVNNLRAVTLGYVLMAGAWLALQSSEDSFRLIAFALTGAATGIVSSRHLANWVLTAEHCQRGTAQSTYMLSWRMAFALGFAWSLSHGKGNSIFEWLFIAISIALYRSWVAQRVKSQAK